MNRFLYAIAFACVALTFSSAFADHAIIASGTEASALASDGGSVPPYAVSEQLASEGKKLYKRRCGACHSLDTNRIGPQHRDVYGRQAGLVSDYNYSKALRKLDIIWTEKTLDKWLANPTAVAKGTSMGYRLRKAGERKAIIEYLKSVSSDHVD
jgi:cytochrome c